MLASHKLNSKVTSVTSATSVPPLIMLSYMAKGIFQMLGLLIISPKDRLSPLQSFFDHLTLIKFLDKVIEE